MGSDTIFTFYLALGGVGGRVNGVRHDICLLRIPPQTTAHSNRRPATVSDGRRQCVRVGLNETWLLQPKLAMRTKADELQYGVIWLAVNQHQIRLDVAIPMVFPVAA